MGACVLICGKGQLQSNEREQAYVEPNQMAEIQKELNDEPPVELEKIELKLQYEPTKGSQEDETHQTLKRSSKTSIKSRFFHQKNEQYDLSASTVRQSLPKLTLHLSQYRGPKGHRKCHFNDDDWADETTHKDCRSRKKDENIFRVNDGRSINHQTSIIVKQKRPLFLPVDQGIKIDEDMSQAIQNSLQQQDTSLSINKRFKMVYSDGCRYTGEMEAAMRKGRGVMEWTDGCRYEGQWCDNCLNGKGILTYNDGDQHSGEFNMNQAEGQGEFYSSDGFTYTGEWKQSMPEGHGEEVFRNGERFVGQWSSGKKNGYGELFFQDGESYYKGQFCENELQGQGEYYWAGKYRYIGQWRHNQKSGSGCMEWQNGDKFEGLFLHDKMHGKGVFTTKDGSLFKGCWLAGRRQGVFEQTTSSGETKRGVWYFNKLLRHVKASSVIQPEQTQITPSKQGSS